MLTIRMQRTGRSGHAQFRVIVQDSRFSPTSGRVTAYLGSYDPHTKTTTLDKEKAAEYLSHGAQPSERVARLLKSEGVKLPEWVKVNDQKAKRAIRNPEKLRRNRPAEAEASAPETVETPAAETTEEAPATETAEAENPVSDEAPTEAADQPAEEAAPAAEETPAKEPAAEESSTATPAEEAPATEEPKEEA